MDLILSASMIGLLVLGLNGLIFVAISRQAHAARNSHKAIQRMMMRIRKGK